MFKTTSRKSRKGFTLVELAVVIVIIGVLASFGVPKFMQSVERSKASEAFNFLSAVRSAQERYQAQQGSYTSTWTDLDIAWKKVGNTPVLQYFAITTLTAAEDSWTATLTRNAGSAGYGTYTVIFTQDGFDSASTIPSTVSPLGSTSGGGS